MITIISTEKSWIEGIAIQQIEQVHSLPDIVNVIGFPDLHAGPVGMAVSTINTIYPHLIGNDIGCGMGFWQTDSLIRKGNIDKMAQKLTDLDSSYEGSTDKFFVSRSLAVRYAAALGTIGGGNHFAELQKVDTIHNEQLFSGLKLDKNAFTLLVHSGSRGLGRFIMEQNFVTNGSVGLCAHSEEGTLYLREHDYAVKWGIANRELIASRFMESLRMEGTIITDTTHNSITHERFGTDNLWIHRKGASPANQGVTIIAGSRGSLSYLVQPVGNSEPFNFSIAHGAGRKLKRNEMKERLRHKYTPESLTHTRFGGRVICEDKELLYEEAPEAYKNIDQVIFDLKSTGLIEIIATYQPVLTFKKRLDTWN